MNKFIISIDGTAGSGKARIAKYIAKKYKLYHLDSGVLYRRFSYNVLKEAIDYSNVNDLKKFIKKTNYLSPNNHKSLRKEIISKMSSVIAKTAIVREFINKQQKIIVKNKFKIYQGCVVDGRDIGSNVFKNAKIKLFIHVKAEIRAQRRHKQLLELGEESIYSRILKEIKLRDKQDIKRNISPLVVPNGAAIVDNSFSFKHTINHLNKILIKL